MSRADTGADVAREDAMLVRAQLGRVPRGPWRVARRCAYGRPTVVTTSPVLSDGAPFPTLWWLTCPWLTRVVAEAESAGDVAEWARRLAAEPELARRLRTADGEYRRARSDEAGGGDVTDDVGIAGQRDPMGTKCLHAHVAARLAGVDDPIGEGVLEALGAECDDDRCAALLGYPEPGA